MTPIFDFVLFSLLERLVLYKTFGPEPRRIHLANSLVLSAAVGLFYLILRELRFPRFASVAGPAVFVSLPLYSTDRFWFAAAQANLSLAFCFWALYCAVKASDETVDKRWLWLTLSVLSMGVSVLAYEACAYLLLLAPVLMVVRHWLQLKRVKGKALIFGKLLRIAAWTAPFAAIVAIKYSLQTRVGFSFRFNFLRHIGSTIDNTVSSYLNINWGAFSYGLPGVAVRAWHDEVSAKQILASFAGALLVAAYLYTVAARESGSLTSRSWTILFATGTLVYFLGYAVFFPHGRFDRTLSGLENRKLIVMSCGVALSMVATIGFVTGFLPINRLRHAVLALTLGLFCGCGIFVTAALGAYWRRASEEQHRVLSEIRTRFPALPSNTVLLLDGVCPYIGPGVVFDYESDFTGALRLLYMDRQIRGDEINPNTRVLTNGIIASSYGEQRNVFVRRELAVISHRPANRLPFSGCRFRETCLAGGNILAGRCPAEMSGTAFLFLAGVECIPRCSG